MIFYFSALIILYIYDCKNISFSDSLNNLRIYVDNEKIFGELKLSHSFDTKENQIRWNCNNNYIIHNNINKNELLITNFNKVNSSINDEIIEKINFKIKKNEILNITLKKLKKGKIHQNDINYNLFYNCIKNGITPIQFDLSFTNKMKEDFNIKFQFIKECKNFKKFDFSDLFLIIFNFLIIFFICKYPFIVSNKKNSSKFTFYKNISFFIIYYGFAIFSNFFKNSIFVLIFTSIMGTISLVFALFGFFNKYFQKIKTISYIFLTIFSGTLAIIWIFTQFFLISDIFFISLIVCILKLIKIKSLREGVILVSVFIFFELIFYLLDYFSLFNFPKFPIELQILKLKYVYTKCSVINLINLLVPSFFILYSKRYDLFMNSSVNFVIMFLSYFFGILFEFLINLYTKYAFPKTFFICPPMIIIPMIFSFQRNEHQKIWNGYFEETFKHSYFPVSKETSENQFEKNILFEGLIYEEMKASQKNKNNQEIEMSSKI